MRERPQSRFSTGEIIDADFVTLAPGAPSGNPDPARIVQPAHSAGMAMLRPQETAPAPAPALRAGASFWLFGTALIAISFWMSGGHALLGR